MPQPFQYFMEPAQAIARLNQLDTDVQASKDASAGAVASATSSAAQAALARDQAIAAWAASTSPAERLAAFSQSIHSGNVVAAFLYDTAKDSDGGAWRKRCQHTSWYNEPVAPGKWLGQCVDTPAAVAAGGVAGDYFQAGPAFGNSYWQIIDPAIASAFQVYRGNTREFPALALIVSEATRVIIYDATQPGCPMWMVFVASGAGFSPNPALGRNVVSRSCIAAINGEIISGANNSAECLIRISFISETIQNHGNIDYTYSWPGTIAQRNAALSFSYPTTSVSAIVHAQVNDVVAAVLPDAPVNFATGLPVPTIAVATGGGVSIIKHDGMVVNWLTSFGNIRTVSIDSKGRLCASGGAGVAYRTLFKNSLPVTNPDNGADGSFDEASIPRRPGTDGGGSDDGMGQIGKVVALPKTAWAMANMSVEKRCALYFYKRNPATPAKSMVANLTNAFNSGWMVGDIRGAWLADTVAEVVSASGELIANGTFDANAAGWTFEPTCNASVVNGQLNATSGAITNLLMYQVITTVPGRTYTVTAKRLSGVLGVYIGTGGPASYDISGTNVFEDTTDIKKNFVAINAATVISMVVPGAAQSASFDNVSVKLVVPDRSVKDNGLTINGSITKSTVAAGAQLVGFSGFSVANYLEQPYNSDLNYAGDYHFMWWALPGSVPFSRSKTDSTGPTVSFETQNDGTLIAYSGAAGYNSHVLPTKAPASNFSFYVMTRRSGVVEVWLNGLLVSSFADGADMTNVGAVLRVGTHLTGSSLPNAIALLRTGVAAPSADQIAQIYRDELPLFQPNAKCTIDGTSRAVTALAYDDSTDLLHVGTSWGRSAFKGLQRTESSATTVAAITALAAGQGAHITGGATGARYVQPAMGLRDELRRRYEAQRAMAKEEIPFDFDGVASQTDFTLPIGFASKGVFAAGVKKRAGATKDYTVTFDGYRETVKFGVSPGATWVHITANRSF